MTNGYFQKRHAIMSGFPSILMGPQVIISKKIEIGYNLSNSADPDEMRHHAAFHLGLRCLPKYPFRCFHVNKGYM